jgi:hypothetical protein
MKKTTIIAMLLSASLVSLFALQADEATDASKRPRIPPPTTLAEARARAMLLHETIHGSLQVMHRDFFEEDESRSIPSASLEDVFRELARSYDVQLKWLIVDTDVVNVDHRPQDEFEKMAAKALAKGKPQFELANNDRYRYAGPIRLASQCLKCHVRSRTSTEDRTAGLVISMPLGERTRPDRGQASKTK